MFPFLFPFLLFLACSLSAVGEDKSLENAKHSPEGILTKPFLHFSFISNPLENVQNVSNQELQQLSKNKTVKVGVMVGERKISLSSSGHIHLTQINSQGEQASLGWWKSPVVLKDIKNKMYIIYGSKKKLINGTLLLRPKLKKALKLGKYSYAGEFLVHPFKRAKKLTYHRSWKGSLIAVNKVDIAAYLKGVVPAEIFIRKEFREAIKVQAILARTYLFSHFGSQKKMGFDIFGDTRDQAYHGLDTFSIANREVENTKGLVLEYQKNLVKSFYHSTCGGVTEKVNNVWNASKEYPYMKIRKDVDPYGKSYCRSSKHFNWTVKWKRSRLVSILNQSLPIIIQDKYKSFSRLKKMRVKKKSPSGRVIELELVTNSGKFIVKKDKIRSVLRLDKKGYPALWSTLFKIKSFGSTIVLKGGGFGHGLGFCQWGGMIRASRGMSYKKIIQFYYPGSKIVLVK